jgi:hypothetical protein
MLLPFQYNSFTLLVQLFGVNWAFFMGYSNHSPASAARTVLFVEHAGTDVYIVALL